MTYTWKHGNYQHLGANIQKCIKIDAETQTIIENVKGRSFSDSMRKQKIIRKEKKGRYIIRFALLMDA